MSVSFNRIALFTDDLTSTTAKALGLDVEFKSMLKEFDSPGTLGRALYYTAIMVHRNIRPSVPS